MEFRRVFFRLGLVLGFLGLVTALALHTGVPLPIGILFRVSIGAALRALHAPPLSLVLLLPFVLPVATAAAGRRLPRAVTENKSIYNLPTGLGLMSETFNVSGLWLSVLVPVPFILTALVYGGCYVVLTHYPLGRYIYAMGGNEEAARLSGVPINRVKIMVYALCGALAGFAGVVAISRLAAADPTSGVMMELDAIAAVVIGGGSLMGGRGHIFGTIVGVVIIAVLHNVMTLLDINPDWQGTVLGAVILAAVLANKRRA